MKEMVEYIARALVRNPDAVEVTEEVRGNRVFITLIVDDDDKGKVIGRDGRVAQAIRSLLRVSGVKSDQRIDIPPGIPGSGMQGGGSSGRGLRVVRVARLIKLVRPY